MTPSTPPKGSLEDLFRHHLLESEAAAVPPRPQVWEHIDNRLLVAQNEKYRHRLATYRWAVAASLLLASLAGGGWWHSQQQAAPAAATLAHATTQPAGRPGLAAARRAVATASAPLGAATATDQAAVASVTSSSRLSSSAIDQTATLPASRPIRPTPTVASSWPTGYGQAARLATTVVATLAAEAATPGDGDPLLATRTRAAAQLNAIQQTLDESGAAHGSTSLASAAASKAAAGEENNLLATDEGLRDASGATATAAAPAYAQALATPAGESSLSPRWASLASTLPAGPPAHLATVAVAPGPPLELARHWQYGASYATSAFQPNIDFSKAADAYTTAFGLNSPIITRAAAVEYRNNLRAGLGQRLSLWATRRLGASRWGLRTGLELTQNTASSASSVAFVGEQVADLAYSQASFASAPPPSRLQHTSYRYRSVSVPVEARYSNPTKTGFSFYGRMGAFVTALLNVHSEVEDNPEATRTYTLGSESSPYRHLSLGLRGGGGVQYRPAGHQWALNLGPVAELGILSLNANPNQDFRSQQRPYSFGLEAGVELGRSFKIQ